MINKFKKYLENEFRTISPTPEALEYREEILSNLIERAEEYKQKGLTDEDLIFDFCIDSLGDFQSTLQNFETIKARNKKNFATAMKSVCLGMATLLGLTIIYLLTSFLTGEWSKTWLIMEGGISLVAIVGTSFAISYCVKNKQYWGVRLSAGTILSLLIVFIYLCLLMLTNLPMTWLAFLVLPIVLLFADTILAFITHGHTRHIVLLGFIEVFCALLYVILALTGVAPWSPTWLLPVLGACLDLVLGGLILNHFLKQRKYHSKPQSLEELEELYTHWNDIDGNQK